MDIELVIYQIDKTRKDNPISNSIQLVDAKILADIVDMLYNDIITKEIAKKLLEYYILRSLLRYGIANKSQIERYILLIEEFG